MQKLRFLSGFVLLGLLMAGSVAKAQDHHARAAVLDVQHYKFALDLSDSTGRISGEAQIDLRVQGEPETIELDLYAAQAGKGMTVSEVLLNGQRVNFSHGGHRLRVPYQQGGSSASREAC
jgi:aminopeptidase N